MRDILYFTVIFSKETLKQFVSFLPKKVSEFKEKNAICFQSSIEGMRTYATDSIAKEFDFLSVTPVLHLLHLACFSFRFLKVLNQSVELD